MTQREIVVELCKEYIKAGQTIDLNQIIKTAGYIMAHTNDYNYTYPNQYISYLNSDIDKTGNYNSMVNGVETSQEITIGNPVSEQTSTVSVNFKNIGDPLFITQTS